MADYTIRRFGDFRIQEEITLASGVAFNYGDYTDIIVKLRQHPDYQGQEIIPGGVVTLDVAPVSGKPTFVEFGLTKTITQQLTRTSGVKTHQLPQLDIRFVPASGRDFYTPSKSVEILNTQSHD